MSKSPLDLYEADVASGELRADPVQREAATALARVYDDVTASRGLFGRRKSVQGLYMYGGVGRGKSMLLALLMDALAGTKITARRVHFHEFMVEVHSFLHSEGKRGGDVNRALPRLARRIVKQSRVLCFDEFHVTDIADAMILGRLFTALFAQGLVMVATSNWSPQDLYKDGLQRSSFMPFIATLHKHVKPLHLDSPHDYRAQFLAEEGVYFTPLGAALEKLDALFAQLTAGTPPVQEVLEVKGREIIVPVTASGIARLSFAQLCEQPHGVEDYLAIAARYHTVFIEDIRKMGYDRRNEAKRFMVLIDALYEAGTRVIFSAEAAPDKLYYGDDHAFEFDRTVSRLQEMQSAEYGRDQIV